MQEQSDRFARRNNDGLLVILSPQAVTELTQTPRIACVAKLKAKPFWRVDRRFGVRPGMEILDRGIPRLNIRRGSARVLRDGVTPQPRCADETPALTASTEIDRSHANRSSIGQESVARC
jgi:hypothetical protein